MSQSVWEQTGDQLSDTAHKAARAVSTAADAFEDGVATARRVAKRGGDAAAELLDDTKKRVRLRPVEAVVATFAAGIVAGTLIGWLIRRR